MIAFSSFIHSDFTYRSSEALTGMSTVDPGTGSRPKPILKLRLVETAQGEVIPGTRGTLAVIPLPGSYQVSTGGPSVDPPENLT